MAPLAPYLLSDFTGADEDPLNEGGRWQAWWPADDHLRRVANTAAAKNPGTSYASSATVATTYPADIHIIAEVATRPTHSSANAMVVGGRITGAGTATHAGYMGAAFTGASQDNWRIYRVTGGSATLLVSGNAAQLVAGDAIGLVLSGTTLELWHRVGGVWTLRQSTTDGTHTAGGAIGLEAKGNVTTPGAFDAIYTSYSGGPADTTITAPFLASATQVYAPTLSNAPAQDITAPFLPSGGQAYAPTLENAAAQDLAAPFLPAATVLYPPTLTNADGPPDTTITAPFLPSAEQTYPPSLSNAAAQTLTAPFLAAQTQLYPPTLTNAGTPETTIVAPFLPAATQLWAPTLSTTRSPAAPHAHPRPVEESIILRSEGGQWMVVGQGAARGIVHEGLSLSADRGGPSTCSFTLKRDPGVSWPDLSPYNEVLVEIGGVRVWSGRMREAPGQSGASNTISFTGSGWQSHLDDDLLTMGWVHSRMSEWVDLANAPKEPLGDLAGRIATGWTIDNDRGRVRVGVANGQSITMGGNLVSGFMLDTGEHGPGARRCIVEAAVTPGLSSSWQVFVRAHNGPGTTLYTPANPFAPSIAADGAGTSLIGGSFAEPCRYVFVFLHLIGGSYGASNPVVMGGDRFLFLNNMWVGSSADVLTNGLTASRVIGDVLDAGSLPRLSRDKSRIFTTGLPIPDYWPQGFQSPRELMEPVNAFHDWHLGVDVDRRVFFEPPSDLPTVEIGEWSGAEFSDASAGSGEDVYSKVIVQASDPAGQPLEVIRTAATAVPELAVKVPIDAAVTNPSFETDTVGWTLTGLARSSLTAGHGAWSLQYDASTTPTGVAVTTLTGLSPGVPHMVTWWTSGVGSGGAGSSVQRITVTGPYGQEGALTYHGGIGWQSLVWVPRGTTATWRFECEALAIPSGGGYVYLDDVRVVRVETNAVDRHRFARAQRLPIGAPLTPAAAETIGDIWLRNHIRTPLKGSVTVTGQGGVREVIGGAPVHPAHLLLRAGEAIRHAGMADPDTGAWGRVGRIASVSYTGGQATIEIDNERHAFEALIARYAALAGQVG